MILEVSKSKTYYILYGWKPQVHSRFTELLSFQCFRFQSFTVPENFQLFLITDQMAVCTALIEDLVSNTIIREVLTRNSVQQT